MTKHYNILILLLLIFFSCKKGTSDEEVILPQVLATTPADDATNVPVTTIIEIEYNKNILLANSKNITLNGNKCRAKVSGSKLNIEVGLTFQVTYKVSISENSIKDEAGNYAAALNFSFTTKAKPSFNIDASLITPNPSSQATNVYNFLKENFQQNIISGTMAAHSTNINEATWVHDQTGKWPALTGFDFIDHTWLDQNWVEYEAPLTLSKDWWGNNGLVTISWHWRDPLTKSGSFYTDETTFDITKINDLNSDEYKAMIVDIDTIAGYLRQFKEANIPVLWRPLHEAAGGWFWWGAKGAAPCKALWQLMYDRMVNYHGLNNLIWVWTTNTSSDALDWYPGHDYVDIVSMDIYPGENQHDSQHIEFDKVKEIFEARKIITLSECGSVPDPASMMEYGDTWSWFMPWNGDFTRSDNHNGVAWWNTFFGYDYVITRDLMPDLK